MQLERLSLSFIPSCFSTMASPNPRDELSCSICLEIYTHPVNLTCGHTYCRECIDLALDTQQETGVYTCPECRVQFYGRPALQRNIALCNIVEHFRPAQPEKEVTGIYCTYCIHTAQPAVKLCLLCETYLCDGHLRVHSRSAEHVLSKPTTVLGNRKCFVHKKILEYFCTEDNVLICVSCRLDGKHKGHQVELLNETSEKKKEKLRHVLEKLISKRKEVEYRVQSLHDRRRERRDNIRALVREEHGSLSVSELIQQLELKKDELSRKMRHIEELCNETDPLTVLLNQESDFCDTEEGSNKGRKRHDEQVHGVNDLEKGPIVEPLHPGLSQHMRGSDVQEVTEIILDINTAANNLRVASDLKTAYWSAAYQNRPETYERFQYNQVVSTKSFYSQKHYWEVETSESGDWRLGVACTSMERRGYQSYIGDNNKSWCLRRLYNNQFSAIHDLRVIMSPHRFTCNRFRICLDYGAGKLSFYELCDPIKHLHTFTAKFAEPLYPAFGIGYWLGSENCWLRIMGHETIPSCKN
ncbi:E3 ubiquitin/ISG15 ligase TRIM25-like [Mixophyes fleayi]|uniref:E3 ubiquitin/ISG15 ligase TRIM25-like n=1 Tax=Mixophyes fleayi TaxID=3061075 RepID=UPI003F4DAAE3